LSLSLRLLQLGVCSAFWILITLVVTAVAHGVSGSISELFPIK
jgi:hypothetical protein